MRSAPTVLAFCTELLVAPVAHSLVTSEPSGDWDGVPSSLKPQDLSFLLTSCPMVESDYAVFRGHTKFDSTVDEGVRGSPNPSSDEKGGQAPQKGGGVLKQNGIQELFLAWSRPMCPHPPKRAQRGVQRIYGMELTQHALLRVFLWG